MIWTVGLAGSTAVHEGFGARGYVSRDVEGIHRWASISVSYDFGIRRRRRCCCSPNTPCICIIISKIGSGNPCPCILIYKIIRLFCEYVHAYVSGYILIYLGLPDSLRRP